MTSTVFNGAIGGLAGADAKCQTAAEAANLGGTWKAWLSTSTVNAIDRIVDVGPWYLVDGKTKVFNNKANLQTSPLAPIALDERGLPVQQGSYTVWSGSNDQGQRDPSQYDDYCADWTGASSNDGATIATPAESPPSQGWGGGGAPIPCDGSVGASGLLCFEQ